MSEPEDGPDVLIIDWLGRGGIAHTSHAWHSELRSMGLRPLVLTRAGRELAQLVPEAVTVASRLGPVAEHLRLVSAAKAVLRRARPDWLVIQGTVLPLNELDLVREASTTGTRVCIVAHEARPSRRTPVGMQSFAACLARADLVVVHSHYVGDRVRSLAPQARITWLPLPKTSCLLNEMGESQSVLEPDRRLTALSFGQLQKAYKGADVVARLAELRSDTWRFALVGTGVPSDLGPQVTVHHGFLPAGQLAATVAAADAVLLPYRRASQSGAVVLAQEVGTPVVATRIGGIAEQVADGVTGLLVEPNVGVGSWLDALDRLTDPAVRAELSSNSLAHVDTQHEEFRRRLGAQLQI